MTPKPRRHVRIYQVRLGARSWRVERARHQQVIEPPVGADDRLECVCTPASNPACRQAGLLGAAIPSRAWRRPIWPIAWPQAPRAYCRHDYEQALGPPKSASDKGRHFKISINTIGPMVSPPELCAPGNTRLTDLVAHLGTSATILSGASFSPKLNFYLFICFIPESHFIFDQISGAIQLANLRKPRYQIARDDRQPLAPQVRDT